MSKKKLILAVSFLCGLTIAAFVAFGYKSRIDEGKNTPSQTALTIAMIKENYKTVNFGNAVLKASIEEFKDVTNYTYLNLKDSTGQIWAAIQKKPVEMGNEIELTNIMVMEGFHSKSLDKTFPTILFAVPSTGNSVRFNRSHAKMPSKMMTGKPPGMTSDAMPHDRMPGAGPVTSSPIQNNIKVLRATGDNAYTIEEIYAKKKTLANSPIKIRVKVVRFLPNIMGKNWIHIQDGTGSSEKMNNDIAVTTLETADVGDEVIVQGVLSVDKDLGAGYVFTVLIEDASVEKIK